MDDFPKGEGFLKAIGYPAKVAKLPKHEFQRGPLPSPMVEGDSALTRELITVQIGIIEARKKLEDRHHMLAERESVIRKTWNMHKSKVQEYASLLDTAMKETKVVVDECIELLSMYHSVSNDIMHSRNQKLEGKTNASDSTHGSNPPQSESLF